MGVQLCGWCFRRSPCQPTQFHSSRLTVFPRFCVCISVHLLHYVIFSYFFWILFSKRDIFCILTQEFCAICGRGTIWSCTKLQFCQFFANKVGAESVGMDEVYARGLSCLVHVGPRQREGPAPHQEASAAPTSSVWSLHYYVLLY